MRAFGRAAARAGSDSTGGGCGRGRRAARTAAHCVCDAVEACRLLAAAPAGVAVDTTWGNGRLVTDLLPGPGSYHDFAYDAAALPGGDVVFAGASGDEAVLVRYNPDGSLDAGFGAGGVARFSARGARRTTWRGVRPAGGGKILAAGGFVSDATSLEQAIIVRFNANGTLDPGFNGGDAFVLPTLGTDTYRYSDLYSLEVLPDGRILAGGYARSSDRETEGASLWRFNANGTRDETFGVFGNTT
jgi:uncharacterized delta-60 repeat protein